MLCLWSHHDPCRPELKEKTKGGVAGPLRCGKGTTWEGGMRVPAIAWWPRMIRHGRSRQVRVQRLLDYERNVMIDCAPSIFSHPLLPPSLPPPPLPPSLPPSLPPPPQLASTLDLLPTIFNLAGAQIPQDRIIDGVDMAPILFKSGKQVCMCTLYRTSLISRPCHVNTAVQYLGSC